MTRSACVGRKRRESELSTKWEMRRKKGRCVPAAVFNHGHACLRVDHGEVELERLCGRRARPLSVPARTALFAHAAAARRRRAPRPGDAPSVAGRKKCRRQKMSSGRMNTWRARAAQLTAARR